MAIDNHRKWQASHVGHVFCCSETEFPVEGASNGLLRSEESKQSAAMDPHTVFHTGKLTPDTL